MRVDLYLNPVFLFNKKVQARPQWLTPEILATQEATLFEARPGK
jgi:hypothetical protein